jgi:hypothetical protein
MFRKTFKIIAPTLAAAAIAAPIAQAGPTTSDPAGRTEAKGYLATSHYRATRQAVPRADLGPGGLGNQSATPAHDEALGGASQVDTALGISGTPVYDEGMGGASQVDTALGISGTPVYDEGMGGASQVDTALGISSTRDTESTTRVVVQSGGFDWGDAGIGAGGGIGLVLLLGAAGSLVARQKHRLSNA